ncbi:MULTISPECIES: thiolase family protein [unclassified Paenibacillus]|uniref:thiolase family protein n=1 Tax=unclassified Paenibacillus TaxID=185978 RepID=UPI001AE815BE|nr:MULTISPECIES: thiolase family protein [unclassified Paenibacillus]MBP1156983.1 acetyl-CoA C-acetyltransferase/3-oxo-5,6-didehydrosuberyl-CoA/3-oxoadipyl-CoA thiolase [Paenibacillus sp. PvP091]MBP1172278.1 acetyl-CoA C-acetyltransferase/3-oxo-5,6-didehydrosuberyl-CoA/3-oxoadipyl-CoA thiolase [Paenibacillus sp. PvR098]MBP2438659.1 acetyl-CoA C-acetyltransferase/3-oxo-5,6-didehydrosuberyl-CoA/3-oxoadipyl-CoA thiolase [Paenibacillus sp. PvP052]
MREAVIVDALRTPIGKYNGSLQNVRPDDLAAAVIRELFKRNPLDPSLVEDVFFGCANQAGEDNRNVARMAVLLSGMPKSVPGVTVNRLCASGLEAINQAAAAIHSNIGDIFIAGGTESMSRAPYVMLKPNLSGERGNQTLYDTTLGWRMVNSKLAEQYPPISLGETAENVAERYGITREEQDEFALSSQLKAQAAIESGRFKSEIVPMEIKQGKQTVVFDTDEHPRADTTLEKLAQLKPAFKTNGSVTAGNSSGINDGASALLIMERQTAERLGLTPIAKIVTWAASGVDPAYMGIGPIPAVTKVLKKANLTVSQLDLIEVNEAFASQSVACAKELGFDMNKVNVNGGAIALGHPLGCSGARIVTTLVHEMTRTDCRYGLATMCIGVGQGLATVIEKL